MNETVYIALRYKANNTRFTMKKYIFRVLQLVIIISVIILLQKCGADDSVNANDSSIGGTVTFTGLTQNYSGVYYYAVAFYWADSSNPFGRRPVQIDSLQIPITGGSASAYYKTSGFTTGNYYVASALVRSSDRSVACILGSFGCDTSHTCAAQTNETKIALPSYSGNGYTDFKSWVNCDNRIH